MKQDEPAGSKSKTSLVISNSQNRLVVSTKHWQPMGGPVPNSDIKWIVFLRAIPTVTLHFTFQSGILSGISFDSLSGILSGIFSDVLSAFYQIYFPTFFQAFFLTYFLTYLLTSFLSFPHWDREVPAEAAPAEPKKKPTAIYCRTNHETTNRQNPRAKPSKDLHTYSPKQQEKRLEVANSVPCFVSYLCPPTFTLLPPVVFFLANPSTPNFPYSSVHNGAWTEVTLLNASRCRPHPSSHRIAPIPLPSMQRTPFSIHALPTPTHRIAPPRLSPHPRASSPFPLPSTPLSTFVHTVSQPSVFHPQPVHPPTTHHHTRRPHLLSVLTPPPP